jgi:predicted transposase YdaD
MGKYDIALKLVLQKWGSGIVQQLTAEAIARWCNPEFPRVSTQFADLLAETESGRLWHLELQATNDPDMPLRMLEYTSRAHRAYGRFPKQCVLYVGREPLRMVAEICEEDLWFRYRLVDIRDLDRERLLSSGDVGDNIIAILTELRSSEEVVRRVLNAIAALEESERQEALEALLLIAGLRELEEMVEQEARKMPVFDDILENKVLGREFKRGLEEGVKQGREEGRHEGRQEGRQEGRRKGVRKGCTTAS